MSDKANKNSEAEVLVHWHFTNQQWREFLYYEKLEFESRSSADLRKVLIGGGLVVAILAMIALCAGNRSGSGGGPAASIFVLIAGTLFIGFCYLIHRMVRRSAEQKLQTLTGEVIITARWVKVNGVIFNWYKGWGVPQIYKDYIHLGEEKMPLLSFTCSRWMAVRHGREQIEKKCLVPVPPGKESEADYVISEITRPPFTKK